LYHGCMNLTRLYVLLLAMAITLLYHSAALSCTVCHSKNPKMVRMHEALEYKDCFVCHGPTAKKSNDTPEKQMTSDERCVRCHAKNAPATAGSTQPWLLTK
jgi:hypothetical protein